MKLVEQSKTPLFLKLIFIFSFYELVIGGGGRFLEVGALTFRMIFFLLAICVSLFLYIYKNSIKKDIVIIVFTFTVLLLFATIVGLANSAPSDLILEDLKPLSFFYIILFFSLVINSLEDITMVNKIIKRGAVLLSVIYLMVILFLFLGYIDFGAFYMRQNEIGEIMFRGDSLFFYKGFLYLCIGFFFFLLSDDKFKNFFLVLLFASIVLTLTRGFILFTLLISFYYVFFINKNRILKWTWGILSIAIVLIGSALLIDSIGDRSDSDAVRYIQVDQVIDRISTVSFFIGNGFGVGVPDRPIHMENSFLEIFHKQGLFGLIFWIVLLGYTYQLYLKISNSSYRRIALPYLLSVIFVYLQSLTNPFLNNPIGLSMILMSIVVFNKLSEV